MSAIAVDSTVYGRRPLLYRRALGRGGQGGGGAPGPGADRSRVARALQAASDPLQDAAHRRVPQRAPAQEQYGKILRRELRDGGAAAFAGSAAPAPVASA